MNSSQTLAREQETERATAIREALWRGPRSSGELLRLLDSSQPTLSRTIQKIPNIIRFREPGVRTPRYALLRQEVVFSPQPIYRVGEDGHVAQVGAASFLRGGGTWVESGHTGNRLYEGLPPAMAFAAPSGYLGAKLARIVANEIDVPASLRDWSDDHRIKFLCAFGADTPGSLIWGQDSFAAHMTSRQGVPIPPGKVEQAYWELANETTRTRVGSGSSGGEQPKFTCETQERGHLIVKFARAGTRSAELLVLEELALRALRDTGVPAAVARYVESTGFGYLEVGRFDRIGRFGRRGMISAGAIDDELFGRRDNWPAFAQRCEQSRILEDSAVRTIFVLTAFSELIGNNDRHFENLSLMTDELGHPTHLAPAYDMLPMMYAQMGGGIDPELNLVNPSFQTLGARGDIWDQAFLAAHDFWERASKDDRLSAPMRRASSENMAHISQVVAPLLSEPPEDDGSHAERQGG
ncbi:MAG: hypothetical protein EPN79_11800 [Burkholderiaceae bacterium]|nr:MAG: hypothetical protein EPN79_11800 [Burkholderiaceae bacterium]TBR76659.1 MAG: hypothetical protein EPN64_05265 [Burkholderiaceae bacterium]